eukprot:6183471-Pleurochrysis_carterae.AAC.5
MTCESFVSSRLQLVRWEGTVETISAVEECLHHRLDGHAGGRRGIVSCAGSDLNQFFAARVAIVAKHGAGRRDALDHASNSKVRDVGADDALAAAADLVRARTAAGGDAINKFKVGSKGDGEWSEYGV